MSHIVHASLFAGGLVLGAGGAILLNRNPSSSSNPPPPALPSATSETKSQAIVQGARTSPLPPPIPGGSAFDSLGPAGYPGPISDLLTHKAYVSSYDRKLRHPHWTAEHLTAASLVRPPATPGSEAPNRGNSVFKEDERIPPLFRARLADYFRSGYDRGHMVPAADAKMSQEAMDETFFLSNMAPQVGAGMNRDYWAHTEDFVRRLTTKFSDLYVFTIPLYLPRQSTDGKWRVTYEVIGNPPNVAVPTHFAKVVLGVGASQPPNSRSLTSSVGLGTGNVMALGAFVMPNAVIPNEAPLESFVVPIETVERAAGLTLFPPAIKSSAKKLCETVKCDIVVRDFGEKSKALVQQQRK
ncbi:hypothetical protein IE53DRAFT_383333 [Violaceomyces palustris]|uniref:Uncharacterized protein n=1 Tax=Violaceomyces palustris TaxID=1673888 RepID=A0ACD0P7K5_9BASI|nr:hypothetical protein IE53DRAFT_383333 [Violaceomyces palustris]